MDTKGGGGEAWQKNPVLRAGQYWPPTTELKGQWRLFEHSRTSYLLGFVTSSAFCNKAWQFSLAVLAGDWAPCTQVRVITDVCSVLHAPWVGGNFKALTLEVPGTASQEPKYFHAAIRQPGALRWLGRERVCLDTPPPAGWNSCISPPGWLG